MSSNPYELRAGLLGQARDILHCKYHQEYERARHLVESGQVDFKAIAWPKPPTSDDIIAEAEKLYRFVQTK